MIVMKFGGSSIADAERLLGVAAIIRERRERRPVIVLSALCGVTDLLEEAAGRARSGDRDGVERALADLERRHRWALVGTVTDSSQRHDLGLELDARFEELRQLLRSLRVLGEGTPRTLDTLLAFGELLSTRIATAAFAEQGLDACWVDPRRVMLTDGRHGGAEPRLDRVAERCREHLRPHLEAGRLPVIGGFVGASEDSGSTTTLGRGGSDTSAAVLGAALGAEEIQIWTDVDGMMSADPAWVPAARTLPELSFAEAAELSFYGARVLHPASVVPAVRRAIPVRVLNSLRPAGAGTVIVADAERPGLASVACREHRTLVRFSPFKPRLDRRMTGRVLGALGKSGALPDLSVATELGVAAVVDSGGDLSGVQRELGQEVRVEIEGSQAILCVVGAGLTRGEIRREVLAALSEWDPVLVASGGSAHSVSAVISGKRAREAVRQLHRRFFEQDTS